MATKITENMVALPIMFRVATEDDINYIMHSWIRSHGKKRYENKDSFYKTNNYYDEANRLFKGMLYKCGALIACDIDDPNFIFAYIVAEFKDNDLFVHWICTKHLYRRAGIAKALLEELNPRGRFNIVATLDSKFRRNFKYKYEHLFAPELIGNIMGLDTTPISPILNSSKVPEKEAGHFELKKNYVSPKIGGDWGKT